MPEFHCVHEIIGRREAFLHFTVECIIKGLLREGRGGQYARHSMLPTCIYASCNSITERICFAFLSLSIPCPCYFANSISLGMLTPTSILWNTSKYRDVVCVHVALFSSAISVHNVFEQSTLRP